MPTLAIVVAAYDRPHSLSRVLKSLARVEFDGHRVPLIISIDRSDNPAVLQVAASFDWQHGEKSVRAIPERLGLKEHILACGDLTEIHDNVIVIEDDLFASRNLYRYAAQAAEFYRDDDRIAGIALYGHLWNVGCGRPFSPLDDPFDSYFMQYACSWGQIWSRAQWASFRKWYQTNNREFPPDPSLPSNVVHWSSRSWLKHHIRYVVETNRHFVYPRVALTTNFSDKGQHNRGQENGYQVPLQESYARTYRFPRLEESNAVYDAFFESSAMARALELDAKELCVDLYGMKDNREDARYWLTLREANHRVLRSFDLALRPHEANVLHEVPGDRIRLYDTSVREKPPRRPEGDLRDAIVKYDVRNPPYRQLLRYALRLAARHVRSKLGM